MPAVIYIAKLVAGFAIGLVFGKLFDKTYFAILSRRALKSAA